VTRLNIILLALLATLPVAATTLEKMSVDQMVERSSAILRGKVVDTHSGMRGRVIYTFYKVQVAEKLKGEAPATLEVAVPGGSYNGLRQTFPGAPRPASGTEYVFFLWQGPSGTNHILGLSQGLFDLQRVSNGDIVLSRGPVDAEFVDAKGTPVSDQGIRISLRDLSAKVGASK
jgi:hypothetical protein